MYVLAFAESIQLFPDGTIFIHIGLVLLMIWVLNRTFFRPINRVLESRALHKGGKGGEAETINLDAADKESAYNRAMLEARSEGYELIEKERAEATAARQTELAAAKSSAAEMLSKEKQELRSLTEKTRAEIEKEAAGLAEKISANILNK